MLSQYKELKSITVDSKNLYTIIGAIKKKRNRVTLNIDYATKTMYISDTDILYTIQGF